MIKELLSILRQRTTIKLVERNFVVGGTTGEGG